MPVPHADITQKIIGSAYTVLNKLKPGLDEKLIAPSSSSPTPTPPRNSGKIAQKY